MRTSPALTILAVLAAVGLVAGCSQGSNKSSASELAVAPGYSNGSAAASGSASTREAAPDAATSGTSGGTSKDSSGSAVSLTSTALIKIADLTVRTKDVSTQAARAVQIATSVGGGVTGDVRTAASTGSSDNASADLTLAVPPASLDPVLGQLAGLGTELSRHTSTQDVAGQVADVNSRVSSAQASITRLQLLFSKAANVTEIVALERELSQREADLESLQAQQRTLGNQTAMATINLHLSSAAAVPPPAKDDRGGFLGGLSRGWDAFTGASAWVFTAVGAGLPFLVLLAVIALGALGIRRRIRRTGAPTLNTEPIASGPGVGE
jgi:hypothetical protein